ncbi:protein ALP1-like [Miscanthus floridulus]|uniref:protein ALP1-like n=1 Tax=Miscanthus floridulus TaxID=154761 RepID=UPI0034598DAD
MFLHVVGHNERLRVVDVTFRRSVETISRFFQKVLYVVGELRNELIVPLATNVHPRILGSRRWYSYFKDCIGAIDGTHVLARVPVKIQAAFRGWKHTITQNVLAAVDFDLRFTYVLAGWEGSAHDAFILSDALERADGLRVPPGKFYLVDAGYAVRHGFLPPFRATRHGQDEHVPAESTWTPNINGNASQPNHVPDNEINNMLDQVVNIGGEDNVVEQGGVVAADDGNPAAP